MKDLTRRTRVEQLKAMHSLMQNANDEEIYMSWITLGVPDEPIEEEFESIAEDDEYYNDCFDLFTGLIADRGCRW